MDGRARAAGCSFRVSPNDTPRPAPAAPRYRSYRNHDAQTLRDTFLSEPRRPDAPRYVPIGTTTTESAKSAVALPPDAEVARFRFLVLGQLEHDAIAAVLLGLIQRLVRDLYHARKTPLRPRLDQRDADADGHDVGHARALVRDREREHVAADLLGKRLRGLGGGPVEQQHELP